MQFDGDATALALLRLNQLLGEQREIVARREQFLLGAFAPRALPAQIPVRIAQLARCLLYTSLVRTATARLAKDGWLRGRKVGKLSEYHLSDGGRERFAEATRRIYSEPDAEWAGRWTVIVLPAMKPADVYKRQL